MHRPALQGLLAATVTECRLQWCDLNTPTGLRFPSTSWLKFKLTVTPGGPSPRPTRTSGPPNVQLASPACPIFSEQPPPALSLSVAAAIGTSGHVCHPPPSVPSPSPACRLCRRLPRRPCAGPVRALAGASSRHLFLPAR